MTIQDLLFSAAAERPPRSHAEFDEGDTMRWTKPAYEDLRLGFEVTMYIFNR